MRKRTIPSDDYVLAVKSPVAQKAVIDFFNVNSIDVYEDTTEFDPKYPYLYWDADNNYLCQTEDLDDDDKIVVNTVEEFLELFFSYYPSLQLNEEYTAYIDPKKEIVTIGSEEIPFEKIMELAKIVDNTKS
jgi:hypothetical protein